VVDLDEGELCPFFVPRSPEADVMMSQTDGLLLLVTVR